MPDSLLRLVLAGLADLAAPRAVPAVIVAGPIGGGKTHAVEQLTTDLERHGVAVGGIVAPRVDDGTATIGYDVRDLETGATAPLARLDPPGTAVGRYFLRREGLDLADLAIRRAAVRGKVVIVDEVGPAELAGNGHAGAIRHLLGSPALPVLVVRASLVDQVREAFGLTGADIFALEPRGADADDEVC